MEKEALWKQHFKQMDRYNGNPQIVWYNVEVPCSLEEVLQAIPKIKLVEIFRLFGYANGNQLKKAELVARLGSILPKNPSWYIPKLEQTIYDFVMEVVNQGGIILGDDFSDFEVSSFLENGILFPCQYNDVKFLYMPDEIVDAIQSIDKTLCQEEVVKSTEIIQLCNGLLYYYGVMDIWFLSEKLEQYRNERIDLQELNLILSINSHYRSLHKKQGDVYVYYLLNDKEAVADERAAFRDIDYKHFTKVQLLKNMVPNYYIDTIERAKVIAFIKDTYFIEDEGITIVMSEIMRHLYMGVKPKIIMSRLKERLELFGDYKKILHNLIIDLYNVTHQWRLKGNSPRDVSMEEEKNAIIHTNNPFFTNPQFENKPTRNHAKPSTPTLVLSQPKVGRNNPCHCGSGKKYKRCCGAS